MTAEGSVYQRKDGRWYAQYRDAKDKVRYIYRKTKAEAKKSLREALKDRDDNIIPPSKMTVGMYLDEWIEDIRGTISDRSWICQESVIRVRVKPIIGDKLPAKLNGDDVRRLLPSGSRKEIQPIAPTSRYYALPITLAYAVREPL